MPGKKKRRLVPPNSSRVATPANIPTRYDFVPRSTTEIPPPVIPTRQVSLRDYPPPQQLFASTTAPHTRTSPVPHSQQYPVAQSQPSPVSQSQPTPVIPAQASSANRAGAAAVANEVSPVSETWQAMQFQTTSNQQHQRSQDPLTRPIHPLPFRPSQSVQANQSPHSSQAQNSHTVEEENQEEADDECLPEPNLSQAQQEALNSLLLAPRPKKITILDPDLLEENSTWFGYDKSALTRQVTKCFTNKFDGPFYNISCVPRDRLERWFVEFAKKHRWDPSITGLVQEHFEAIIQVRLKDMVSTARHDDERPKWIEETLWDQMKAHWSTEEQKAKSATTSAARMSQRKGLGPHKHASGQKSYRQIEQEMVAEFGRPVSFGEVFIRANTKKDGTFADKKAEQVAEAYMKRKQDKLDILEAETTEVSDGRHPVLSVEEDNDLFIQSTFTNDRGELFGIGSLKDLLKGKGKNLETSSSFRQMQQQLEEAQRKLEEQAVHIAQQEAENARLAAAQQAHTAQLALMNKFLETDDRFLAFLARQSDSDGPSS